MGEPDRNQDQAGTLDQAGFDGEGRISVRVTFCMGNASPKEQSAWRRVPGVAVDERLCLANCSDCRTGAYAYVDGVCHYATNHTELMTLVTERMAGIVEAGRPEAGDGKEAGESGAVDGKG